MIYRAIRLSVIVAIVVLLAVGASMNEFRHKELMQRVQANTRRLMTDPDARPDSWTATEDRKAMSDLQVWGLQEINKACEPQQQSSQ